MSSCSSSIQFIPLKVSGEVRGESLANWQDCVLGAQVRSTALVASMGIVVGRADRHSQHLAAHRKIMSHGSQLLPVAGAE